MKLYYTIFLTLFSSIPYSLLSYTLQNWQLDAHLSIAIVSAFSYMQLPYLLNPIWGYVIDKTHKYQDEKVHLMMGVIFVGMACFGFSQIHAPSSIYFWLCGFLMCFGGAWFDAALGAYRSHFAREILAQMSASVNLSYRMGMIAFQAGLIFVAQWVSWQQIYFYLAMLAMCFFVVIMYCHISVGVNKRIECSMSEIKVWFRKVLSWPVIAFIFLFNASHFWITTMMVSYFREILGLTSVQVAVAQKGAGLVCLMIFTFLGMYWIKYFRLSRLPWLMYLQVMVAMLMYIICHWVSDPLTQMYDLVMIESAIHGIMSTYIVAFILELAPTAFPAMGVALMTSIAMASRSIISPLSGLVYDYGEQWFWFVGVVLAVVAAWVSQTAHMVKICSLRKT